MIYIIDCYDGQENFKHYMERIDLYFYANNIGLDYKLNDDTNKNCTINLYLVLQMLKLSKSFLK